MVAEKVRDGAYESFGVREIILGLGVTGLGTRGVGCVRSDARVWARV